jgi:heme-degrading monooxygenase HmoA
MYTRATIVQIRTDKLEEAIAIYRDSVVPAAKQQAGFHDAILLLDRNTGKGISLTFWNTVAEMEAGEGSGYYQQQLAKFKDIFTAAPIREQYEVSVQALTTQAMP